MPQPGSGLHAWLWQRATALYLGLYLIYLAAALRLGAMDDYASWRGFMSGPWNGIATAIALGVLVIHAWIGLRDIVMDYLPSVFLRLAVRAVLGVALLGCAWLGLAAVIRLH